ncbi:hypothetical protein GWI33_005336 [Rhynchophorus ferrugineus]|uniref:Uncharacterized protein n=1 Tax=Rhynchophorus ferrugineus TaxID=354439 RepID=A0A834IUQ6_RHYFE|nr:hypothetical protein GWI33_005336 [Rhynchophorus ferrugineus]
MRYMCSPRPTGEHPVICIDVGSLTRPFIHRNEGRAARSSIFHRRSLPFSSKSQVKRFGRGSQTPAPAEWPRAPARATTVSWGLCCGLRGAARPADATR